MLTGMCYVFIFADFQGFVINMSVSASASAVCRIHATSSCTVQHMQYRRSMGYFHIIHGDTVLKINWTGQWH